MTRRQIALIAASVFACFQAADAVETAYFKDSLRQEFGQGEKEGVYVDLMQRLVLAPDMKVVVDGLDYAWSAAADASGAIYAGTLPDGKIYRHDKGASKVFFETGEGGVFSLLAAPDGSLIAGTGPQGRIYRITADGAGEVLADLDEEYVFALAQGGDGSLLAATGGSAGRIYRISKGAVEKVYDSPSAHLLALAVGADGSVYAASGDRGAVYRVSPDGKATILFSAPQRVVQDIAVTDDGTVYAATAAIAEDKPGAEDEAVRSIIGEIQARRSDNSTNPAPGAPPAKRTYKVSNSVYKIDANGSVTVIFNINGALILSLLCRDGLVYCGTAGVPGIFVIDAAERRAGRLYESKSEQVLDLAGGPGGSIVAALGMPGQLAVFGPDLSRSGTFTSRVIDSGTLSRWGRFKWLGNAATGTSASFSIRAGNSPTVDATWTEFLALDAAAGTSATQLPPSRYAQYRAELATAAPDTTPVVSEVEVAALPLNLAPVITAISAGKEPPKAAAPQQPRNASEAVEKDSTGATSLSSALSGRVFVYWKADDANSDKMAFSLFFKDAQMKDYLLLEDELSETKYPWDTTAAPDGDYFFKVTASDSPSNTAGSDLSTSREEGPFTVDNTPPVLSAPVVEKVGAGLRIALTASDASSPVASAAYSVDAGKWQALLPVDGMFDSPEERLSFTVDKSDASIVVVRAVDLAGNSNAVMARLR